LGDVLLGVTNQHAPFLFVVDTTDYAGNFERELCAYITGRVGECGKGQDQAKDFVEETGLQPFENVMDEPDEHGCHRPAAIYATPGWFNHGHGEHFEDTQEGEASGLIAYRVAVQKYRGNSLYHSYLRLWVRGDADQVAPLKKAGWTLETLEKRCEHEEKFIAEANALTKVHKHPAFLSVAISFSSAPTRDQLALMKARAYHFSTIKKQFESDVPAISKITGFRLMVSGPIKQKTETT